MILRSASNYDRNEASNATALVCKGPGRTQQSGKEEADINTIVRRFGLTGQLPQNVANPGYIDFDGVFDYQTAMNAVVEAQRSFQAMPAEVRERFGNSPERFVDFCSKPENGEELVKLGLAVKKAVVDTQEVPPVVAVPPVTAK